MELDKNDNIKSYELNELGYLLEEGYLKEIEETIYRVLRKVKIYRMTYNINDVIHIDEDDYVYLGIGYEEIEDGI